MSTSPGTQKHSVSLPSELSEGIRERVDPREFSAYIARAVDRQLKRDALDELLADMAGQHGPVDEHEVEAILAALAQ